MPDMETFHETNQDPRWPLFSILRDHHHWGYGSLGNLQAQGISTADETVPSESIAEAHFQLNAQFDLATPGTRLRTLKTARFSAATKAERVQRSLQALSQPLGINLSAEDWALVAELTEEDEE